VKHLSKFPFSLSQRIRVIKSMRISLFCYKTFFLIPTQKEDHRFRHLVTTMLWGQKRHKWGWVWVTTPFEKGGLGLMGLTELCETYQAALLGRLRADSHLILPLDAWVQNSLERQDLPWLNTTNMDTTLIKRDCWPLVGWWKWQHMSDLTTSEVRLHTSVICKYPMWGALNTSNKPNKEMIKKKLIFLEDFMDNLGGPLLAIRAKNKGINISHTHIAQYFDTIPPRWVDAIEKGAFQDIILTVNTEPQNTGVKECKKIGETFKPLGK
jgi:hypothetical protein